MSNVIIPGFCAVRRFEDAGVCDGFGGLIQVSLGFEKEGFGNGEVIPLSEFIEGNFINHSFNDIRSRQNEVVEIV